MSKDEFKREERYVVTKIKSGKQVTCVVVEEDWPEYELIWSLIQDRMEGRPNIIARDAEKIAQLEREVAMLVDALKCCSDFKLNDIMHSKIQKALSSTQSTAEQYEARVKAEALDEAANRSTKRKGLFCMLPEELRAMAYELRAKGGE